MISSIAIIIPAFNEEKTIAHVIKSVAGLTEKNNLRAKIVVVNDCSTDRTKEIAEEFRRCFEIIDKFC